MKTFFSLKLCDPASGARYIRPLPSPQNASCKGLGNTRPRGQLLDKVLPDAGLRESGELLAVAQVGQGHRLPDTDFHVDRAAFQKLPGMAQHLHVAIPRYPGALMSEDRQAVEVCV